MLLDIYSKRVFNYYEYIKVIHKRIYKRVTWPFATNLLCSKEKVQLTYVWFFKFLFQPRSFLLSHTWSLFFPMSCVILFWKSLYFWSNPQIIFSNRLLSSVLWHHWKSGNAFILPCTLLIMIWLGIKFKNQGQFPSEWRLTHLTGVYCH